MRETLVPRGISGSSPDAATVMFHASAVIETATAVISGLNHHNKLASLIFTYFRDTEVSRVVLSHFAATSSRTALQQSLQAYERDSEKQLANDFLMRSEKEAEEYVEHYRGMVEREG